MRHYIGTPAGPVEIAPFTFAHEGSGPHRSCDSCLAVVEREAGSCSEPIIVHAAGCGAAKGQPRQ